MSIAIKYKGRFAVLIPTACNPHKNLYKYTVDSNTALWIFNNSGDKDIFVKRTEEEVKLIHENNGIAYMTIFDTKGHTSWRHSILKTPLIDWILWYQRNPSPYRPPYNVTPPVCNKNYFFKLFFLPLYASGILVILPMLIVSAEKITKLIRHKKCKFF
jgi:hypothetical protein